MTFSIMTFSIMTFSIMTFSIMTFIIMPFSIMTFSIMTFSIMTYSIITLSILTFRIMTFSIMTSSLMCQQVFYCSRFLALPTNIRFGWKGLPGTKTLAFCKHFLTFNMMDLDITNASKSFIIVGSWTYQQTVDKAGRACQGQTLQLFTNIF